MKNAINYYYNLYPNDIHQTEKGYYFFINNTRYFLTKYLDDPKIIQNIYNIHLHLLNQHFYVHPIILNNQNQIITTINNEPYILMITIYYKNKINLNDIIYFLKTPARTDIKTPNWGELWANKNDYLEYQISMLGQNHPLLRESFSYYIGLGETAIQLVNSIDKTNIPKVYAHKRLKKTDHQYDLYNPLNLTIDYQVRDIAEYLKNKFFSGENIEKELTYYLNNTKLSVQEYLLFLARLIYPTYYFDLYEEIITNRIDDIEIKKIIDKSQEYEILLKKIYHYYQTFIPTPKIDWFE